jgi:hypothetical protein
MRPYYDEDGITIYHADCRDLFGLITADVLVTDPPFGIAYASGSTGLSWWHGKQIAHDEDTSLRDAVLEWWGRKPALIFGSRKRPEPTGTRMVLIWDKGPALGMGALDLPWKPSYEEIYVLGRGFTGRRDEGAVIYEPPVQAMARNGRQHPNEKPVGLMARLIAKCPPGVVLDTFAGVGSTLVAAKLLGRRALGCEIEERYCEIAARRLSQGVLALT